MYAQFERFTFSMTREQALSASQPGKDATEDVEALLTVPAIKRQLKRIDPAVLAAELKDYGAWDEAELQDHEANCRRIVWIAACNIREGRG